ncbi:unnamed protein product [Rhodiola kirilowii]
MKFTMYSTRDVHFNHYMKPLQILVEIHELGHSSKSKQRLINL